MATTLLLVCIAPTASSREGRFPDPQEPVDAAGSVAASRQHVEERFHRAVRCSPALAAIETARALGLDPTVEPALADVDYADWSGRSIAEIDPQAMSDWLANPAAGVPEGESMEQAVARIGPWLDTVAEWGGAVCGITHPMMVRAALAHTLAMPIVTTLSIDIAPLSRTVLSFNRTWRLQSLGPVGEDRC